MIDLNDVLSLDAWVTADHHWEHPRIREYQNRPSDHFEIMRERWLDRVRRDDVVLHLGDLVCFGDPDQHPRWVRGLPGDKYLIRGNHDKHSDEWYEAAGFTVLGRGNKPFLWVLPEEIVGVRRRDSVLVAFSHEPLTTGHIDYPYNDLAWDVNVHGHVHANDLWDAIPGRAYRNVCVEVTDYAPIRLRDTLSL